MTPTDWKNAYRYRHGVESCRQCFYFCRAGFVRDGKWIALCTNPRVRQWEEQPNIVSPGDVCDLFEAKLALDKTKA